MNEETKQTMKQYVCETTEFAVKMVENLYDVKLTEEQIRELAYTIGKKVS